MAAARLVCERTYAGKLTGKGCHAPLVMLPHARLTLPDLQRGCAPQEGSHDCCNDHQGSAAGGPQRLRHLALSCEAVPLGPWGSLKSMAARAEEGSTLGPQLAGFESDKDIRTPTPNDADQSINAPWTVRRLRCAREKTMRASIIPGGDSQLKGGLADSSRETSKISNCPRVWRAQGVVHTARPQVKTIQLK